MNQNKIDSMEAVGELVDDGNLLLQENGFPHLPASQSDAWNEAGTKPDHPCLCETRMNYEEDIDIDPSFQYWNGDFFGLCRAIKSHAIEESERISEFQDVKWREVQP